MPSPLRRRLLHLGFALVPLLLLLAGGEALARFQGKTTGCGRYATLLRIAQAMPPQTVEASLRSSAPMPDDVLLGWINLPNFRGMNLGAPVRHNALGLRGPDRPSAKPAGWRRVAVLGDSTIYGHGVAEEQTFAALFQADLQAKGAKAEVINAGVPAYSTLQSLHQLQEVIQGFSPDLVVIANLWSDSIPHTVEDAQWLTDGPLARAKALLRRQDERLSRRSALWCALKSNPLGGDARFQTVAQPSGTLHGAYPTHRVPPEDYARNLESLVRWSREHGAVPVFLGLSSPYDSAEGIRGLPPELAEDVRTYRGIMTGTAARLHVPYADSTAAFVQAGSTGTASLFFDAVHPTATGHRLLATALTTLVLADPEAARQAASESCYPPTNGAPILLLLLACDSKDPLPKEEAPPPADWTFSKPQACATPGKVSWKLDPHVQEYDAEAPEIHNDLNPGALALAGEEGAWKLYWTQVDGLYQQDLQTQVTSLVSDRVVAHALAVGDLDQDGGMDLVFASWAAGVMYSDGTLALLGNRRDNAAATDVSVVDLDADGDLDVLVAWSAPDHSNPSAMQGEIVWNDGNRAYHAEDMGVGDNIWGPAFDFTARDVNGDGTMDAYLCNDMGADVAPNRLFLGDGTTLVPHSGEGLDQRLSCMGSTWGDLDQDGSLELYISESVRHVMMKQDDEGNWYDIANTLGLTSTFGEHTMSWGAVLADFDNNGRMELVDALGDFWIAGQVPNRIAWYEQDSDGTMVDIGADRGVPELANGRGVIAQDLNGDGVLDLLLGDANRTPWLYLSEGCTEDNWLEVEAPGGSEVRVEAGDWVQSARIDNESGWGSSGPTVAHLGLADRETVDRVVLRRADGMEVQVDGPIGARRRLTYTGP